MRHEHDTWLRVEWLTPLQTYDVSAFHKGLAKTEFQKHFENCSQECLTKFLSKVWLKNVFRDCLPHVSCKKTLVGDLRFSLRRGIESRKAELQRWWLTKPSGKLSFREFACLRRASANRILQEWHWWRHSTFCFSKASRTAVICQTDVLWTIVGGDMSWSTVLLPQTLFFQWGQRVVDATLACSGLG